MTQTVQVERVIAASAERLFTAWTTADQLARWWGPKGVVCLSADVDARLGGRFRIGNALPDGRTLFIVGEFLELQPPTRLMFTWSTEPQSGPGPEQVTVTMSPEGNGTRVVVKHERIADPAKRDEHELGWLGCLDGLDRYVSDPRAETRTGT